MRLRKRLSSTGGTLWPRPVTTMTGRRRRSRRIDCGGRRASLGSMRIDASIAARADYEYLYDKPYEDNRKVRVAGPFTVDSLSPHRVLAVDEDDELIDRAAKARADYGPQQDFAAMILEQLATAGVQQGAQGGSRSAARATAAARIQVRINGVDVFHPTTGEVRSDGADGIACWFIDTDYNEESFFVRHAYFLGANDPYKALKTTLKAEIDADAWASLHSDLLAPVRPPASGRIAVKVINHLGDEVMKVFRV